VVGRDSGIVMLEGVTVSGGHVVSGSDATVSLTHSCQLQSVSIAMMNYGGCLTSNASISSSIVRHLHAVGNGSTRLLSDSSTGDGSPWSTAIYVAFNSDSVSLEECVFTQYDRGVKVIDSWIVGDSDWKIPADSSNNSFRVDTIGLEAESSGDIYLGETAASPSTEALNEIDISNQQGFHAVTDGTSTISARQNWWGPSGTPNTAGTVATFNELTYDPVPFAANRSALSKQSSISATPPSFPGGIRDSLVSALRQKRIEDVRRIAGQFMRSASFLSARYGDLRSLHHALRTIEATDLSDTLLTLLLTQSGVEVKLLAADMLTADGLHEQAVSVLNSYSFAGSPVLLKRALLRKALLYPYAQRGGYHSGLRVLDSLRQLISAQDPLHDFCEMYPILYSNLRHRSVSGRAKNHVMRTALDRVIPEGLEIGQNYPNPFQDVTSFTFKLGDATHVRLSVHDAMGREVAVITDADFKRGVHSAILQSAHLPSGLYFYRFISDKRVIQRKMVLIR
jgi:hypothetical protein